MFAKKSRNLEIPSAQGLMTFSSFCFQIVGQMISWSQVLSLSLAMIFPTNFYHTNSYQSLERKFIRHVLSFRGECSQFQPTKSDGILVISSTISDLLEHRYFKNFSSCLCFMSFWIFPLQPYRSEVRGHLFPNFSKIFLNIPNYF